MHAKPNAVNEVAKERGQKLSQMALSWNLRNGKVTTVLVGASKPQQIIDDVSAINKMKFEPEEIVKIEEILKR